MLALALVLLAAAPGAVGYETFTTERLTVGAFAHLGRRLRDILPPGTTIGCGSTGAIGYYTDMPIVDILGLTERFIARHGAVVGTQPGHLKTDGAYVIETRPDLLLFGNIQIHRGERGRDRMRLKIQEEEIASSRHSRGRYDFVNIPLGRRLLPLVLQAEKLFPAARSGRDGAFRRRLAPVGVFRDRRQSEHEPEDHLVGDGDEERRGESIATCCMSSARPIWATSGSPAFLIIRRMILKLQTMIPTNNASATNPSSENIWRKTL